MNTQTTTPTNLNENEMLVLAACAKQVIDCTNGEFGYTSDVKSDGLSKNQIKGYISQLVQKGMITPPADDFEGQFNMNKAGILALGKDPADYDHYR